MASRGTATWATRFALALTIMVSLGACGGDDDGDGEGEGDAGDGAGAGGGGGMSGGAGGAGGRAGSTSTAGSTGGGAGGIGGLPMAMCDTSIPTTATCGGTACPASTSMFAALTCTVPCCTDDDECGLLNAIDGMVGNCAGPAVEDPSCPGYQGMLMTMAIDLPGCCSPDGKCGAISTLTMTCITTSPILTDLMPGDDCGDDSEDGGN